MSTTLWGGVYNPIIPIADHIPEDQLTHASQVKSPKQIASGYIRFFEPDVFVECRTGLAASIGIEPEEAALGIPRTVNIDAFFAEVDHGRATFPFGLDIFEVYRDKYLKEYQFQRYDEPNIVEFRANERDALFSAALSGELPKVGRWRELAKEFRKSFRVKEIEFDQQNWKGAYENRNITPLYFTRSGLRISHQGRNDNTIFVVNTENPADVIDYWNLRLFKRGVIGLSIDWLPSLREWLHQYITEHHRLLPGNPHGVMTRTTVQFGRSFAAEQIEAALDDAGLSKFKNGELACQTWYEPIWQPSTDDRVFCPKRAEISAEEQRIEALLIYENGHAYCRFRALYPKFADRFGNSRVRWANVLKVRDFSSALNLATLTRDSQTSGFRVRMSGTNSAIGSTEGIVLLQEYVEHDQYLSLADGEEALIDILARQGLKAKPSAAGRIARQVIDALGGLSGVRLIADRETIQLLDSMAKSRRTYADGTTEDFPDRTLEAVRWKSHLQQRANRAMFLNTSLDDFVRSNVLRLGLAVSCPNCQMENWYPIGGIGEENKCERCLRNFPFPQGGIDFKKTPWKFRVVGPFSVPKMAGGAYATVLTLRAFKSGLASGSDIDLVYSSGLDLIGENATAMEVDFAFLMQRSGILGSEGPICLAFGEAKSFAADAFQQKDVERLRRLGAKFPGAFLVFSTLKDTLSAEERSLIAQLAHDGNQIGEQGLPMNPVIILTGFELFSEWRIEESWSKDTDGREKLAHASVRFDNLWELARITQKHYLQIGD